MRQIEFTTPVLGKKAAERLKAHQVTQTIRSPNASAVLQFPEGKVDIGDLVEVTLDGEVIGHAEWVYMDSGIWADLDLDDALRCGFDNRFEMLSALKRAGFRFKDIVEYEFYRIQFTWREESGVQDDSYQG